MYQIYLVLAGIFSGIVAGMGMGGGTILVPILTLLLGLSQRLSQAINLIAFLPLAIVTVFIYAKKKMIDFSVWWKVSLPACIMAIICSYFSLRVSSAILKICYAFFLIVLSVWQIVSIFFSALMNAICKKNY